MFLAFIGFIIVFIYFYYQHKYTYWSKRGIRGPKPYPIIGTLIAEQKLPPRETEKKLLKEYGPVFGTFFNSKPILNTSVPEHIKTVLGDLKTFPNVSSIEFNDRFLSQSIFFRNGMDWKTGRQAQTFYFTSKNFRNLLGHFEKVSQNFLENIGTIRKETKSDDIEVKMMSKYYGTDCIAKVLFAIDVDSYKERDTVFVKAAVSLGEVSFISAILCTIIPKSWAKFFELQPFKSKPVDDLGNFFKKMLKERSGIKYGDLSEVLQNAVNDDKLVMSEDAVIGNILLAFLAGVEPVSNALSKVLYFLSENADVQQKLYEEIKRKFSDEISYEELTQNEYLDAVVQETLRLGGNILFLTRTASVDTKLGDIEVEKGTEIRLIHYLSNLDSENWSNPLAFNPDRFLKGSGEGKEKGTLFVPFGSGHKQCLGMRLAQLEIKYLLVRLLVKYELTSPKNENYKFDYFRGFISTISMNVAFKERTN